MIRDTSQHAVDHLDATARAFGAIFSATGRNGTDIAGERLGPTRPRHRRTGRLTATCVLSPICVLGKLSGLVATTPRACGRSRPPAAKSLISGRRSGNLTFQSAGPLNGEQVAYAPKIPHQHLVLLSQKVAVDCHWESVN